MHLTFISLVSSTVYLFCITPSIQMSIHLIRSTRPQYDLLDQSEYQNGSVHFVQLVAIVQMDLNVVHSNVVAF